MAVGEPLEREIRFDISPALGSLRELDDAFEQVAASIEQRISSAITDGLSAASQPIAIEDVDATAVSEDIAAAIDAGAAEPVALEADASDIPTAIDGELQGIAPVISIDADTAAAEGEVEGFVGSAEANEIVIGVDADTTAASDALEGFGEVAGESATKSSVLAGAVQGLTEKFAKAGPEGAATGGAIAAMGGEAVIATGGVALVGAAIGGLAIKGAGVIAVLQQFQATFGKFSDTARNINVAGLNDDLGDLAVSLGVDDEAALAAASRVGALAQTLGQSQEQAAQFSKNVVAVAASVSSANPALGDLDTVTARIGQTLARNPAGLKRLGIEVTPAEIDALATSLGKIPEQLSQGERAGLAAEIAVRKIGNASDEVAARQQNAQVLIQATQERIANVIEAIAVPVALPILEALKDLSPLLESLEPLASLFGKAIALAVTNAVKLLAGFVGVLGVAAEEIGHLVNAANDLPIVGRAIGDDLGNKFVKFGKGAREAAEAASGAGDAAGDATAPTIAYGTAADLASAGLDAQAASTQQAADALLPYQAAAEASATAAKDFQTAVEAIVSTAEGKLPTSSEAFSSWQEGIKSATDQVATDQDKVAEAFKRVGEAQKKGAGLDEAVATYNAAAGDLEGAKKRLIEATDPQVFLDNLTKQTFGILTFTANLRTLLSQGQTSLVEFLQQQGPAVGGAIAAQLVNKPALAAAAEAQLDAQKGATADSLNFIENESGPAIEAANAEQARKASEAYAANYQLRIPTLAELGITADTINTDTRVADETSARAFDASRRFGTAYKPGDGVDPAMQEAARRIAANQDASAAAAAKGVELGADFGFGIAEGINRAARFISQSGAAAIDQLNRDMRRISGAQSPALLFAELGDDIAAGVALGIDRSADLASQAGADLIKGAAAAAIPPAGLTASVAAQAAAPAEAAAAAAPPGSGVVVQGPLIGEVNENADPMQVSRAIAFQLTS